MSQLDLIYLVQPLAIIAATSLLLLWYYRKKLMTTEVIGYSAISYFVAIVGKTFLQAEVTLAGLTPTNPFVLGTYYGLQTVFLEVGLAYLFAKIALENRNMRAEQAPAYGAALAFWENGILLGVIALPGLAWVIATGGSGLPSGSPGQVLQLVALGTLERVSSIIAHFSWGILCMIAAATKKTKYLVVALPMGFIDFLVPFAPSMSLVAFELIVFSLSVLCLAAAYMLTKDDWPAFWGRELTALPAVEAAGSPVSAPVTPTAPPQGGERVHNSQCPKCQAVFAAEWSPFLPHMGPLVLRKCPACQTRSFMPSNVDSPLTWPPAEDKRLH